MKLTKSIAIMMFLLPILAFAGPGGNVMLLSMDTLDVGQFMKLLFEANGINIEKTEKIYNEKFAAPSSWCLQCRDIKNMVQGAKQYHSQIVSELFNLYDEGKKSYDTTRQDNEKKWKDFQENTLDPIQKIVDDLKNKAKEIDNKSQEQSKKFLIDQKIYTNKANEAKLWKFSCLCYTEEEEKELKAATGSDSEIFKLYKDLKANNQIIRDICSEREATRKQLGIEQQKLFHQQTQFYSMQEEGCKKEMQQVHKKSGYLDSYITIFKKKPEIEIYNKFLSNMKSEEQRSMAKQLLVYENSIEGECFGLSVYSLICALYEKINPKKEESLIQEKPQQIQVSNEDILKQYPGLKIVDGENPSKLYTVEMDQFTMHPLSIEEFNNCVTKIAERNSNDPLEPKTLAFLEAVNILQNKQYSIKVEKLPVYMQDDSGNKYQLIVGNPIKEICPLGKWDKKKRDFYCPFDIKTKVAQNLLKQGVEFTDNSGLLVVMDPVDPGKTGHAIAALPCLVEECDVIHTCRRRTKSFDENYLSLYDDSAGDTFKQKAEDDFIEIDSYIDDENSKVFTKTYKTKEMFEKCHRAQIKAPPTKKCPGIQVYGTMDSLSTHKSKDPYAQNETLVDILYDVAKRADEDKCNYDITFQNVQLAKVPEQLQEIKQQ